MSVHNEAQMAAEERELAVLEAWLDGDDLPEGTLFRELTWLEEMLLGRLTTAPVAQPPRPQSRWTPRGWKERPGVIFAEPLKTYRLGLESVDEDDSQRLPTGHFWGLTRDGEAVAIDCPLNNSWNVSFPTGFVLVEWVREEEPVKRALLKVTVLEKSQRYHAWKSLTELFEQVTSDDLRRGAIYLTPVALVPHVRTQFENGGVTHLRGSNGGASTKCDR
jgi:hypothetical protein